MKFIDEVFITLASGHGGPGAVSFRREALVPRGGPDGGDGGRGGNVIVRVNRNLSSLVDYKPRKRYAGQDGRPGEAANCTGADGADYILQVPAGTIIRDEDGNILADMTGVEEQLLLKGGRGGKGNAFFKTSVNQAPDRSQPGEEGQEISVLLELKLIADVGIIGFPNAGKSTLISRISAAKPKIADYPFTTLVPNLGVVRVSEFRSFVVADIPGLIKGAHKGAGLGIQFLKHIERTRVFVHLIDISPFSSGAHVQDYMDINFELEKYDEGQLERQGFVPLSKRPQIVVFTKADTLDSLEIERKVKAFEKETQIKPMVISAVSGKGLESLIYKISEFVFLERESL